ncbi:MAG: YihY/virulence factor BrkB family protein [Bryobacteraceae bacterium]
MRGLLCQMRAIRCSECWDIANTAFTEWVDDKAPRLGAALAFYTALSLAPLLVVVLAVAGLAYGKQAVQGELVWQIQDLLGKDGARAIQALISAAHRPASGIIATILGLITLFFGASSAFVELSDALNTIWHVPVAKRQSGLASVLDMIKRRAVSFIMVLGVGFLLLVSLLVAAWIAATESFFRDLLPMPGLLLELTNFLIGFLVVACLFAVVYKVLPDVRLKWSDVTIGAVITALLFSIGKFLIALYLGRSTIASSYGAAGSFLIVLLWVYYSAQVFFLGAEFTKIYTLRFGSHFKATLELQPERSEHTLVL